MNHSIVRSIYVTMVLILFLPCIQPVVFAQDDSYPWPYLPSDAEINNAVEVFVQEQFREEMDCSKIQDFIEKQKCLSTKSLGKQLTEMGGGESYKKREVIETSIIKMHHPNTTPGLTHYNGVLLLYTRKSTKSNNDEVLEYDIGCLTYWAESKNASKWYFSTSDCWWLSFLSKDFDKSLSPRKYRDAKVNLMFRDEEEGFYGWKHGFMGENIPDENRPPEVHLTYSPKYPTPSDKVELTANATDPDGNPLSYTWFVNGEKIKPTSKQVRMWDLEVGEYLVEVQVTDGKGGTDESLAVFEVRPLLAFLELRTGKTTYDFNEAVKVIYELKNWGEDPVDFYVEYRILDLSKNEVFYNKGGSHSLQPGESQGYQSEKFVVPDDAIMGSYEIQAKCINDYGTDEIKGYFTVVNDEIDISYLLGYEMPFTEQYPVPLRIKFKLREDSHIVGITSVEIIEQDPLLFFVGQDVPEYLEYKNPGVKEAVFDFGRLLSKNVGWLMPITEEKTVSFVARIGILTLDGSPTKDYEQDSEIEIPFKVKIKAAFSVCAVDSTTGPDGEILTPKLDNYPLDLDKYCSQPVKGFDWSKLVIYGNTRVVVRDLSGAAFSIGDYGGGDTLYWEVTLSQANAEALAQYQMSDSAIRTIIKKQGKDLTTDKALEFLFQKAAKKVSGPLGIMMEVLESDEIGGEKIRKAVIRLRSILGVSVSSDGKTTIRNYEGDPEILLPDGSAMTLASGYETSMEADGFFTEPKAFDTSAVLGATQMQSTKIPAQEEGETTRQLPGDYGDDSQDSILPWVAAAGGFITVVIGALVLKARKKNKNSPPKSKNAAASGITGKRSGPGTDTSSVNKKAGSPAASRQDSAHRISKSSKHVCPGCGQPIRAGAAFCRNCGEKIE